MSQVSHKNTKKTKQKQILITFDEIKVVHDDSRDTGDLLRIILLGDKSFSPDRKQRKAVNQGEVSA
ncbi:hypothetical protein GCM10023150_03800 [Kangiella taiwanensis]|uniref:Uncharacterized protein n=1 Tax=Kangiella taiwanensis TaxID=1079179 RepID=A0ABP8HTY7_9GAMM